MPPIAPPDRLDPTITMDALAVTLSVADAEGLMLGLEDDDAEADAPEEVDGDSVAVSEPTDAVGDALEPAVLLLDPERVCEKDRVAELAT